MNIKNNQRYKSNSEKIEKAFLNLIKTNAYETISISELCNEAHINRSTFYAHYSDINDLIMKIEGKFAHNMASIFNFGLKQDHQAFIDMFTFVKENKIFYKAFLKIPYATLAEKNAKKQILDNLKDAAILGKYVDDIELFYRANFFGAGIKAMCELWLERDCKESPQKMAEIIYREYTDRKEPIINNIK